MKKHIQNKIFNIISEVVTKDNLQAYVIGGYVRDAILQRNSKDIDVVVVGSGIKLAKAVSKQIGGKQNVTVFKNFGTAMLKYGDIEVEFVGARKESYNRDSRKPVVENGTLEDDQIRRDFTINALAISLHKDTFGNFVDPFNGMNDLKQKIIKTPTDPNVTFSDDPLRMMRAIRFASQLGFTIEKKTFQAIVDNVHRIEIVSGERIIIELNKILLSPKPSVGLKLLSKAGLLNFIFPELENLKGVDKRGDKAHKDNFLHTLQVVDNVANNTNDLWLLWAAVLHDIAKPKCKRFSSNQGWTFHGHEFQGAKMVPMIFKKMKLPLNDKMKYVQKLVLLHLRPIALVEDIVTDSAIRRLLFDAGNDTDDLMALCRADITSKNEVKIKQFLKNFDIVQQKLIDVEKADEVRNWQPPISGELIMETFNIQPSRAVGIIKNAIKDAVLDGVIKNDYDEAYTFMIEKGKEIGLKN